MTKKRGKIYIGTSGWMYKDWSAKFYPRDLKKGFLSYFVQEFNSVEINSSFYHLPLDSTFIKWRSEVPPFFKFSVKMSRYVTHQRKLIDCYESIDMFLARAKNLKQKLGIILIQLPPSLSFEKETLQIFLSDLKRATKNQKIKVKYALEPRHASWMETENAITIRKLLKSHKIVLVFPHSSRIPSFEPSNVNILSDFAYVRFHGPGEFAASRYGVRRLTPCADKIRSWSKSGIDVYVYFNNDIHGFAIEDAKQLRSLIMK